MAGDITLLATVADFDRIVREAGDRLVVCDFSAEWCGPCHAIAPVYQRLAGQWKQAVFTKCDVDANRPLAARFNISAMPTFLFLRNGQKIAELKGANPAGLQAKLQELADPANPSYAASSTSSAPSATGGEASAASSSSGTSLLGQIDKQQSACLNEVSTHPLASIFQPGSSSWLESDADEQLLISLATQNTLKLRALKFTTVSEHAARAPKTVRVFINRPTISFDDAEAEKPVQELVLTPDQAAGKALVPLRYVAFQRVQSVQLFVKDNQGGTDETRLDSFDLFGETEQGTADLKGLRKEDEH